MRIIGGSARGRKLTALPGDHTRPTLDKVRGAVFNVLFDVNDAVVLDFFGGSGAMGLEALSRGAARAVIVENDAGAFGVIRKNRERCSFTDRAELRFGDFRRVIGEGERFDLIFLDPPYRSGLLEEALRMIAERDLLKPGGTIVAETSVDEEPVLPAESMRIDKVKQYGKTKISFIKS